MHELKYFVRVFLKICNIWVKITALKMRSVQCYGMNWIAFFGRQCKHPMLHATRREFEPRCRLKLQKVVTLNDRHLLTYKNHIPSLMSITIGDGLLRRCYSVVRKCAGSNPRRYPLLTCVIIVFHSSQKFLTQKRLFSTKKTTWHGS